MNGRGQYNCSLAAQFSNSSASQCNLRGNEQCAPKILHVLPNQTYRLRLASTTALASLNLAIGVSHVFTIFSYFSTLLIFTKYLYRIQPILSHYFIEYFLFFFFYRIIQNNLLTNTMLFIRFGQFVFAFRTDHFEHLILTFKNS